jgi:hypothetical protein
MSFDIKRATMALIHKHENPLAPITISNAYGALEALGKLMADVSEPETVKAYNECLLSAWDEEGQLEEVCCKPEFVMALCAILSQSLIAYVNKEASND